MGALHGPGVRYWARAWWPALRPVAPSLGWGPRRHRRCLTAEGRVALRRAGVLCFYLLPCGPCGPIGPRTPLHPDGRHAQQTPVGYFAKGSDLLENVTGKFFLIIDLEFVGLFCSFSDVLVYSP